MVLLVDTDVDFMTEVFPVCRDESVSSSVCVFLGNLVTLHSHVFLEAPCSVLTFICSVSQADH